MRRSLQTLCLLMALLLAGLPICSPALAQAPAAPAGFSAKGIIQAPDAITLFAPMGGQVGDFSWQPGDRVQADEPALSLSPAMITAAGDGHIAGLQAQAGDMAAAVMGRYGALAYIKPLNSWRIEATISSTADTVKNRDIAIGQSLRVQHGTGDDKVRGEALVVALSGKALVLEMPLGDFELEDDVKLYLPDSKDNARADYVGSGLVSRPAALPVGGEGIIAAVLVSEGDEVSRGQPLMLLDSATARYTKDSQAEPEIHFAQDGVIGEVYIRPGQFVQQGQALMSILPQENLEAALEVDELDIARVRVGDSIRVSVDAYDGERSGTVKRIMPLGQVVLDTTKFIGSVAFESSDDLLIGMHVRGYWD